MHHDRPEHLLNSLVGVGKVEVEAAELLMEWVVALAQVDPLRIDLVVSQQRRLGLWVQLRSPSLLLDFVYDVLLA